jgi:F-type H+-transporting ATPase subunit b
MRRFVTALVLLSVVASPALAAEGGSPNMLSPNGGLMFWTLVIFFVFFGVLAKFAFKPIIAAVEAREAALQKAISDAQQMRDEAAKLLAEQQEKLAGARAEAQDLIAQGRAAADRLRADLIEQAKVEQTAMLDRARKEIEVEKTKAIAELRSEAVDLALKGAGKVIEKNLDDAGNRALIESFLVSVGTSQGR